MLRMLNLVYISIKESFYASRLTVLPSSIVITLKHR